VRAAAVGPTVRLTVSDTGMGVPADEQSKLFTRFYRSSGAQGQAIPGTGLGLAIVKTIVDQHAGTIGVSSTAGLGTTFTIDLPPAPVVGAAA
jgi:signal transduction histidine kinase